MTFLDTTPATLLSLEDWRQLLGFSPFFFWGLSNSQLQNSAAQGCDPVVRQHAWQGTDAASRTDILQAIADAERLLTEELDYAPAPRYTAVTVPWPRYPDGRFARVIPVDATGRRLSVHLPEGYVQALGVEALTLLDTPAAAYTDEDGDGLIDTVTLAATVPAGTDPATLAVYVPAGERFDGSAASDRWRIRPIRASVSGTTATIIGRSWTCVRPRRYEGMPTAATPSGGGGPLALDPDTTANYCATLEVYARTTDPNGETLATCQAVLEWDTRPAYLAGWCASPTPAYPGTNAADPAAVARVVARCGVRDAERGIVLPATAVRNATTGAWAETWPTWWEPDRVVVRGLIGRPDGLTGELARAIAQLSAALLARRICACDDLNAQLYHWQFDLTLAGRQDELYSTRDPDLDNPFGPRRGAVAAWKAVKRLYQTRATVY